MEKNTRTLETRSDEVRKKNVQPKSTSVPKSKYRKIPIISPGAYFWSKGLYAKILLWGVYIRGGGGLYMHECLRFEKEFSVSKVGS